MKSAVDRSHATMQFQAIATLRSAFTSLSCGWASMGSQKNIRISISPVAIIDPTCWSPPIGPLSSFLTVRSNVSSRSFPVVPVANSSCLANTVLLNSAQSIRSFFLLSCATSAMRLRTESLRVLYMLYINTGVVQR